MLLWATSRLNSTALGQVHLGNDRNVGGIKNGRIFKRLIFSFRDREQNHPQIFAELI
jgi:hypothetical protein